MGKYFLLINQYPTHLPIRQIYSYTTIFVNYRFIINKYNIFWKIKYIKMMNPIVIIERYLL